MRALWVTLMAGALTAQPKPQYEVYAIRYATIPDFAVSGLVADRTSLGIAAGLFSIGLAGYLWLAASQSLKAAELTNVKIVGQGATPTNIQYLHSGQQAADVAFPYYEVMYAMVNAAIQDKAGMPVAASVAPPKWLLIPANAPTTTSQVFPVVTGYQSQYEALWGK